MEPLFSTKTELNKQRTVEPYWDILFHGKAGKLRLACLLLCAAVAFWGVFKSCRGFFDGYWTLSEIVHIIVVLVWIVLPFVPHLVAGKPPKEKLYTRTEFFPEHFCFYSGLNTLMMQLSYCDVLDIGETEHYFILYCRGVQQCFLLEKASFEGITPEEFWDFMCRKQEAKA